jgi:hypothetical protein
MDKTDFVHEEGRNVESTNEKTPGTSGVFSGVHSTSEEQGGPNWTRTSLEKHRGSDPTAKNVHDLSISASPDFVARLAELLHHEYGFSQPEVARILDAAKRAAVEPCGGFCDDSRLA